jgi:hypothetical protein
MRSRNDSAGSSPSLVPSSDARLGHITFGDRLTRPAAQ